MNLVLYVTRLDRVIGFPENLRKVALHFCQHRITIRLNHMIRSRIETSILQYSTEHLSIVSTLSLSGKLP